MKKIPNYKRTTINVNKTTEGEHLERMIERAITGGEKLEMKVAPIYTERKDGINPAYNPRTDRFEIAIEASDKIFKSKAAATEEAGKATEMKVVKEDKKSDESTQATE